MLKVRAMASHHCSLQPSAMAITDSAVSSRSSQRYFKPSIKDEVTTKTEEKAMAEPQKLGGS